MTELEKLQKAIEDFEEEISRLKAKLFWLFIGFVALEFTVLMLVIILKINSGGK